MDESKYLCFCNLDCAAQSKGQHYLRGTFEYFVFVFRLPDGMAYDIFEIDELWLGTTSPQS